MKNLLTLISTMRTSVMSQVAAGLFINTPRDCLVKKTDMQVWIPPKSQS